MTTSNGPRLAYLSGPAHGVKFFDEMKDGGSDYFGTNYMKRFIALVDDLDVLSYVITWHDGEAYDQGRGRFRFHNRPLPKAAGLMYHVRMLIWHIGALVSLWRFRPDVLIVTGNQDFWWTLAPLRLLGTRFVASYHSVIWPRCAPATAATRFYSWLNANLILRKMVAIVMTSAAIREQVEQLVGSRSRTPRLINHLPSYEKSQFAGISSPLDLPYAVFEIIFLGRMEVSKGIYDLLSIAEELERSRPGEFKFHFLGDGSELSSFRNSVSDSNLEKTVIVHGYCKPEAIQAIMSHAHVSVVPTRSTLTAGFEMTCAEAILSGRPLITSAAAPALDYLRPASIEVKPDDIDGYLTAILKLKDNRPLYEELCGECVGLAAQFYDEENSWTVAMREALALAFDGSVRKLEPR